MTLCMCVHNLLHRPGECLDSSSHQNGLMGNSSLMSVSLTKIESEEYEEALSLAHTYGLDTDLVYQRQWRKSAVNIASIQNYLVCINSYGNMITFISMDYLLFLENFPH